MKILKYLLIAFTGVSVLIGGAIAYIVATFNPNSYKPQIIKLVKDKKQRTLKIDGDIKLKFWPNLGADLGKVALSEFNSEAEFAAVDNARVSLKLMPLLSKNLIVDEVEVAGVRATIVKYKDGRLSIDDLLSKDDKKSEHVEFDIAHVKLENAALTYRDEAKGATYALSNVNLKTGRIAPKVPTPVALSMSVKSDKPKTDLAVVLNTKLTFDLDNEAFNFEGTSFEAKGHALDATNIDAKVSGNLNARVKADEFSASGLSLAVSALSKGTNINAKVTGNATAKFKAGDLSANGLAVALKAVNQEINIDATANVTGNTTVKLQTNEFAANGLTFTVASTQKGTTVNAKGSVTGSTSAKLNAGELTANGLTTTFSVVNNDMNLNGTASGSLNARLNAGELTTNGLKVAVTGNHGKDHLDIQLDAPKLLITKDKASGDKVAVAAKITNPQGVTVVNAVLPGIEGSATAFKAAGMTLDVDMKQGEQTVKAHMTSPVSGNIQTQQINLPQLVLDMTATGPNLPGKSITGKLAGSVSVNASKQQVQTDVAGKIADMNIKAQININGFSPPGVNFDVDIDQLDVDKYAPQTAGKPAGGAGGDTPIDVSALRTLRANGKLRIGALKASGFKASNVVFNIKAAGGQVQMSPLSANLYEGAMSGAVSVNATQAVPSFVIQQNLTSVAIGPLLRDLANKDNLEGKGSVTVDVRTQGATVGAFKRALNGSASVNLRDGSVKGIDIAGTLRDAKAKLGALRGQQTQQADKTKKTEFSEMSGSFTIQNGVAHNNDLSMKSPLIRVGGEGDINIGEDTVNYLVKAAVVGTLTGQDGRSVNELRGVTIPVRAKGPLTAPSFALDFNAMITDTVKQKVEDTVKGKLEERLLGKAGADAAKAGTGPSLEASVKNKLEERLFGKKPAAAAPTAPTAPAPAAPATPTAPTAPATPSTPTAPAPAPTPKPADAAKDLLKGLIGR